MRSISCLSVFASCILTTGFLTGCSTNFGISAPGTSAISAISGAAHGGRQPIVGAHIYLLEANIKAYAGPGLAADDSGTASNNASKSLLTSGDGVDSLGHYVLTQSDGSFNITGDYSTCDTGAQVYLYSLGGKPDGVNVNTSAGLMAVLGTCGSFGSGTTVNMNELSTIAAAYAFAGFATDATHVGAPSSTDALAATGITNAFANAQQVFDISSNPYSSAKSAPAATKYGTGAVPQQQVNTLANILAACINSATAGTQCSTLFSGLAASGTSGTQATATATEAIYMAHNPGVTSIYSVTGPGAGNPYTPWYNITAPDNWMIQIVYTDSSIGAGQALAVDGAGNIWGGNLTKKSVFEVNHLGVPTTGSPFSGGGLNQPTQLVIDSQGNAWIANYGDANGSATKISVATNPYTVSAIGSGNGISVGIAVGKSDDVWILFGSGLVRVSTTGAVLQTITSGGGLSFPWSLAVDGTGNVWVGNLHAPTLSEFSSTGTPLSGSSGYTGGGISFPYQIAVDHYGQVWAANNTSNAASVFANNGTPLPASPITLYSDYQDAVAIDGSSHAWFGTFRGIAELDSNGSILSPSMNYQYLGSPVNTMSLDGSGNLWVFHNVNNVPALSLFLGTATPVVTPIAVGAQNNTLGSRP